MPRRRAQEFRKFLDEVEWNAFRPISTSTTGFVVLAVFYRPRARPPDNSFGDARNSKIGLTACHIRLDHRHKHFIMVF